MRLFSQENFIDVRKMVIKFVLQVSIVFYAISSELFFPNIINYFLHVAFAGFILLIKQSWLMTQNRKPQKYTERRLPIKSSPLNFRYLSRQKRIFLQFHKLSLKFWPQHKCFQNRKVENRLSIDNGLESLPCYQNFNNGAC